MTAPVAEFLSLDTGADRPLTRQLYRQLRQTIIAGNLPPGTRLPSTRSLARDLGVSRNTVAAAFEQLGLEGYVTARTGSGTRVASSIKHFGSGDKKSETPPRAYRLSQVGRLLMETDRSGGVTGPAFSPSVPDPRLFPRDLWGRLLRRAARRVDMRHAGYTDYDGLPILKTAIADHLAEARGVGAHPHNIVITSSAQAALDLAARLLINPGERALLEEPGYLGARAAFLASGARTSQLPVDTDGANISEVREAARLIYVTPSHHYPLGVVMSLERRLKLLEYAAAHDGFVIEDDFDSEFHYRGQPVPALASLDRAGHTLYLGTFAKSMIPAIRVAYIVLPDGLAEPFRIAVRNTGQVPSVAVQAALAEFVADGHLRAHIRRVGAAYRQRRDVLVDALRRHCPMLVVPDVPPGGMQLAAAFTDSAVSDISVAGVLRDRQIGCTPLSGLYTGDPAASGLLLGFAMPNEDEIVAGARRLSDIYRREFG